MVKSLDRRVKYGEIVNNNGKDYAIGYWIKTNHAAFKNNKIQSDRLALLRELEHIRYTDCIIQ